MRVNSLVLAIGLAATLLTPAAAKEATAPAPPPAYKELVSCKQIADPAQRLACFDATVSKLEQAMAVGEVLVTDRAAVRETKKGLFGFKLPTLGLFGGGSDDKDEIDRIEATVASARASGYGSWRITMADGSVWEQTDTERLVFDPKKGDKVEIFKAALSSFRMKIDGQRPIRVRRVE